MMILTTGITPAPRNRLARCRRRASAFTLLELIVVMAIVAILLAFVAPSLSSSMRGHQLDESGLAILATTEYARDQAISQGIPMDIWLNAAAGKYGVKAKPGFPDDPTREKQFALTSDVHFDSTGAPNGQAGDAAPAIAEFAPDGSLEPASFASLRLVDRSHSSVSLVRTSDGNGYEIQKAAPAQ